MRFYFRKLSGAYNGPQANPYLWDLARISDSFADLATDLPEIANGIAALEVAYSGVFTGDNFDPNSVNSNIFLNQSIAGSKFEDDSIEGTKLAGITDANIAPNAAISPGKIQFDQLHHSTISGIGTRTHPVIDSAMSNLFSIFGDYYSPIFNNQWWLGQVQNRVWPSSLSTTAQELGPAINELDATLNEIDQNDLTYLSREDVEPLEEIFTEHLYLNDALDLEATVPIRPVTGSGLIPSGESQTFVDAGITSNSAIILTPYGLNTDAVELKIAQAIPASGFYASTKDETNTTNHLEFSWIVLN